VAITSSDTDGDTVSYTYAWFVNGSAAGTSSTLSGTTAFSKGQSVYVRVTPTDGTSSGSAVTSSTATVANSTPGAPGVELDPELPEVGVDDLWCAVTTPASDAFVANPFWVVPVDGVPTTPGEEFSGWLSSFVP
jgi:hypothetical protein